MTLLVYLNLKTLLVYLNLKVIDINRSKPVKLPDINENKNKVINLILKLLGNLKRDVTATISFRFSIINPSKRDDHLFQVFTQTIPLSGIQVRVFFRSEMEN